VTRIREWMAATIIAEEDVRCVGRRSDSAGLGMRTNAAHFRIGVVCRINTGSATASSKPIAAAGVSSPPSAHPDLDTSPEKRFLHWPLGLRSSPSHGGRASMRQRSIRRQELDFGHRTSPFDTASQNILATDAPVLRALTRRCRPLCGSVTLARTSSVDRVWRLRATSAN